MGKRTSTARAAFGHTIPVLAGYVCLGAAYGLLMQAKGLGLGWTLAISVCTYAGSLQFVMIGLLTSAFEPVYAFLLALMVNARHLFYGISMLGRFQGMGWKKWLLVFGLTDETFSIHCAAKAPEGVDKGQFMLCVSLLDHSYWIIGSVIGSVAGALLKFDTTGVDFAMTALFVVIAVGQWKENKRHLPALLGGVCTFVSLSLIGPDNFLLPALGAIVVLLLSLRGTLDEEQRNAACAAEALPQEVEKEWR